jgi:hypothetical protein
MRAREFAIGIFVCGLAIPTFAVNAQDTEAVSSLMSRATSAVQAANLESWKFSIASRDRRPRCVGVIPRNAKTFLVGSSEPEGVVTCLINGNWSSPFIVRTMPLDGNTPKFSDRDMVFLTYGTQYSSEDQFRSMKLQDSGGSSVFSAGEDGRFSENFIPSIGIETDTESSKILHYSPTLSPEKSAFVDSVRKLTTYIDRGVGLPAQIGNPAPAAAAPLPPQSAAPSPPPSGGRLRSSRVTGISPLVSGETEPSGFGLYSYALIAHSPSEDELPIFKAFFTALLALPTSRNLTKILPLNRINITEVPTTGRDDWWDRETVAQRVMFVLLHYDYARASAILASLPQQTGTGPVIISVLVPIDASRTPDPVLVEDLTLVEPTVMTTNVAYFVNQASKDQFWKESTLDKLCLNLRNKLAATASATGKSKEAVLAWVNIQHAK